MKLKILLTFNYKNIKEMKIVCFYVNFVVSLNLNTYTNKLWCYT